MAKKEQKSQAQKAASSAKAKAKNAEKKSVSSKNTGAEKNETKIPARLISSVIFLACFVLFAIIL